VVIKIFIHNLYCVTLHSIFLRFTHSAETEKELNESQVERAICFKKDVARCFIH